MYKLDLTRSIPFDRVASAYIGKSGCMCGCNGDYAYPENYRAMAGRDRGYDVRDDEVSDRKVKTRLNRLLKLAAKGDYDNLDQHFFGVFLERNGRTIALYFKKESN